VPIPSFSTDSVERRKSFPGCHRGTPTLLPPCSPALWLTGVILIPNLPSQVLKDAPLQRVLCWPRLVLVGAAEALLRAELMKPQGSSKPGRGQLLLRMGNRQRRLLGAGLPKETWLKQPSYNGTGSREGAKPEPARGVSDRQGRRLA